MADKDKFQRLMDAAQRAEGLGHLAEASALRAKAAKLRTNPEPEKGNALAAGLRDAPAVKTMTHGRDSDASSERLQEDSGNAEDDTEQTSTSSSEVSPEGTETIGETVAEKLGVDGDSFGSEGDMEDAIDFPPVTDGESDGVPAPGSAEAEAALPQIDLPEDEDEPLPSEGSGEGDLCLV